MMNSALPSPPIVVALTGASGTAYAVRLLGVLLARGYNVQLIASEAARQVAIEETGTQIPGPGASHEEWQQFPENVLAHEPCRSWGFAPVDKSRMTGELAASKLRDFSAGIASGSFRTRGMVICPCSTGTLAAIASGSSTNLIHRSADVHLKERRPLILVPRETPLSLITLRNMQQVTEAGAVVVPAMPGFYHQPSSIAELVDFMIARICDLLSVDHSLSRRWSESDETADGTQATDPSPA